MRTLILSIFLVISSISFAQEQLITKDKKQEIYNYINHFEQHNKLMGTVSVFENGQEIISKTFGKCNVKSPSTENKKYAIGSITKLFTAVLMAKLKEDNKIDFNEKLSAYFPSITNAKNITLKQMLNHTSGLKDYVVKNDSLPYWLKKTRTHKEIMEEIINEGVAFNPGDSMKYSNSAYYLLGKILEKKYQKSFNAILQTEIAKPLNLKNTIAIDETNKSLNFAKSYEIKNNDWQEIEEFYFPNAFSAGSIVSTAKDLNIFLNNLFSYKIISEKTLKLMLPEDKNHFGLGIMKVPFYEHISYGHGGDTYGTHSVTFYNIDNNISVTYIINGEEYPTNNFAIGLLSIIYGKDYKLPNFDAYNPDKRFYHDYEGVYTTDKLPMSFKVYQEDNELKVQAEGQPSFTLTPKGKHIFEFLKAGSVFEFDIYKQKMTLKQSGQVFEMIKK